MFYDFERAFKKEWRIYFVAAAVMAVLIGYHIYYRYEQLISREQERLTHSSAAASILIGKQLQNINTTLTNIRSSFAANKKTFNNSQVFYQERLMGLANAMQHVQAITILDANGTAIYSSNAVLVGQSFAYREYFKEVAAAPDADMLYVSSPFTGVFGDWLLPFAKVITNAEGKFNGLILILLNSVEYSQLISSLRPTSQSWASLAHGQGMLFVWEALGDSTPTGQNLNVLGSLFSKHRSSGQTESFYKSAVTANQQESLVSVRTIIPDTFMMSNPLVLAVGRSYSVLTQLIFKEILFLIVIFIVLYFALATLLFWTQHTRRISYKEKKSAERFAKGLSDKLSKFVELTPSIIVLTDIKGAFKEVNPAFQNALGYTYQELMESTLIEYIHPDEREEFRATLKSLTKDKANITRLIRFRSKNATYLSFETSIAIYGDVFFIAGLDVTEREIEKAQLQLMAYKDRLTGLPNRGMLWEHLNQAIHEEMNERHNTAVLFIDLDGFKLVNDTCGHESGDKVLKIIGKRLLGVVRENDTVGRLGGDEFVVILSRIGSERDVEFVAKKILETINHSISLSGDKTVTVGASIGISIWPDHAFTADELLNLADKAMYESKRGGKNRYSFAN